MNKDISENIPPSVSVVIPTLGGTILKKTVKCLNAGSLVPDEIIICIPEDKEDSIRLSEFNNIKIIKTPFYGQVRQRAEGFKNSTADIVLQLDDDIELEHNCLNTLVNTLLASGPKSCVGPIMYNRDTGKTVSFSSSKKWIDKLYYWIINGNKGFVPGTISKAGTGIGHFVNSNTAPYYKTEWLAGGCIAHYRDNLITDNYYPFNGKAFCEDLIHSVLLRQNGCSLILEPGARCGVDIPVNHDLNLWQYISLQYKGYKANRYFVRLNKNSLFRMNLYYLLLVFNHAARMVRKKILA